MMKVNKKSNAFTSFGNALSKENEMIKASIEEATSTKYEVKNIPLEDIEFNPNNTRFRNMDTEESIAELATSIKAFGLIHPVAVFPHGNKFMLFSGERRTKAFMFLNRRTIPANVFEDSGDLENMEKLYEANLQSRELDVRTRFLAVKDLLEKYENSEIQTAELARKAKMTKPTFLKYKSLLMNAEDGDIALFESGDITVDELIKHTTEIIKKRNNVQDPYGARIDIISRNTVDTEAINYIDTASNTVYSVERDENGQYCTAVTDINLFKVPLHYQNQVYETAKQAQISLNLFALSKGLNRYDGDFSEYKKQSVSPIPAPEATKAEADSETNTSEAPDPKDYAPNLMETIPTQIIGEESKGSEDSEDSEDSEKKTEEAVDSKSYVTSESEPEEDTDEDRDVEVSESDVTVEVTKDTDVPSKSGTEVLESSKSEEVTSTATPAKSGNADYLDQIATFSGYSPVTKTRHYGALFLDSSSTKAYIITDLNVSSAKRLGNATFEASATFIEVERQTILREDIM